MIDLCHNHIEVILFNVSNSLTYCKDSYFNLLTLTIYGNGRFKLVTLYGINSSVYNSLI
jgi:hypothetical protein